MNGFQKFALLLSLILLGCTPVKEPKVKIAINPWPGYEFLYLAEQKGIFSQVNLNIELIQTSTLSDAQRAYLNGYVDGFTSTLIEVVQVEPLGGKPVKLVLLPDYSNGGDVIISDKTISGVQQLKGKKIGCEVSSLGIYVLQRALMKQNLTIADVTVINIEQANGQIALTNGDIDAYVTYPPYSVEALRNPKYHQIFSTKEIPNEVLDTVAVSAKKVQDIPNFIKKLQQAWQLALTYHQKYPEEANAIMAKREQIKVEEFSAVLSDLKVLNSKEQQEIFAKPEQLLMLASSVCNTLIAVGSIESNCSHINGLLP